MLVLSRRVGESIVIGDGLIKIQVVGEKNGRIRLGIIAPKELSVNREEIQYAIDEEKKNKKTPA